MAEEQDSVFELEGLEKQLQKLLGLFSGEERRADSETFCLDFCKLVESYASRWKEPLPQLEVLETALCYFARASTFFTTSCDHVLHTLSSLALSVFELLLFFDQKDFQQEPLKQFTVTFQECLLVLSRHQNVHLLQVQHVVGAGGPWTSSVLQAILSEASLPQSEVDVCIGSELPVFLELRVRYLLSCGGRLAEAMALARRCAQHPTAGQHLFFLQVYLAWLSRTSQHDSLLREVADLNGKVAVHIICSLECEEKDELLLTLSKAFISQQLRRGDMYYLCDLVFLWSKLHSRLKTSKQALLEQGHQLMLSATNVNAIFPFIRAILQELGEDGLQFCVELCANALDSGLPCDVITKSLIYKTIAGLLPNDLEVCRACALLVFFLERTVEAYKMVYLLYMHPDQEYHVEHSPIRNQVRFETLQVLKKGLYFDPEFYNLITLRTNCLKLMSEKVVSAALEEIMEEKWIHNYRTKEPASKSTSTCRKKPSKAVVRTDSKKRHYTEDNDCASKRLKLRTGKTRLNVEHTVKRKGQEKSSQPLRRSYWQLERLRDNVAVAYGDHGRTTRLSEKNPPKRKIRTPKWLLEDSGTPEENNLRMKKRGLKHQQRHRPCVLKRSDTGQIKNNAKYKSPVNSRLTARENNTTDTNNKHQKELLLDCLKPAAPPLVILELSLPDNELFLEDNCNRQRGFPQVLLYKPTVKLPATPQPLKNVHRKEVVLRARDPTMFVQQIHCYVRREKGNGHGSNAQGSVSTITRSSVQGSPPKDLQKEICQRPGAETRVRNASRSSASSEARESRVKAPTTKSVSRKICTARELSEKSVAEIKVTAEVTKAPVLEKVAQSQPPSARELCEESAVEMKVTIASQTSTAAKVTDKVSKAESVKGASRTRNSVNNNKVVTGEIPAISNLANVSDDPPQSLDGIGDLKQEPKSLLSQVESDKTSAPEVVTTVSNSTSNVSCENDTSPGGPLVTLSQTEDTYTPIDQDSVKDLTDLTLVTEMVTELAPEKMTSDLDCHTPAGSAANESTTGGKSPVPPELSASSSCSEPGPSPGADWQRNKEETHGIDPETQDDCDPLEPEPESEESRLEYCCTFCNKVFKGRRVVAHAMFHFRKDECMFCGTVFKDDLLAMMHLSDHIEKLKKIADTKDIPKPKTSAKARKTPVSPGRRRIGRSKAPVVPTKSPSLPGSTPAGSRRLRSRGKPEDGPSSQRNKQTASKHMASSITPPHKVNGHIGKKRELDRPRKARSISETKQPLTLDTATSVHLDGCSTEDKTKQIKTLPVLDVASKQDGDAVMARNVAVQEKVNCPVDGCNWFKDLSKSRVALLYHVLGDHDGEVAPLELAFHVGNGRCTICMRVMWSFEHFQHHVERHRLAPRHPCLHRGCTVRFKSGNEMRRHARRHSPLQAVCCLPGCSQLFICLWALNLHERDHYASKAIKPDKNTNEQTEEKHDTPAEKKQPNHKIETETSFTSVNDPECVKAVRKSRGQDRRDSSTGKHITAHSPSTVGKSKQDLAENDDKKDLHVLKNLSNKGTSAQLTGPNLRLRQTLRKVKVTNTTLSDRKRHKVISSSLRHTNRVRRKFKKIKIKGPKRKRVPPVSKDAVHDENTTTGQNNGTVKEKSDLLEDQKSPAELPSSCKGPEISREHTSQHDQDTDTTTETPIDESKSKKTVSRPINKNHIKQKGVSTTTVTAKSSNQTVSSTSADKTQKSTVDQLKNISKTKKRSAPKGNRSASRDSSNPKKHKITNKKAYTEIKKKCPIKATGSDLKRPAKSKCIVKLVEAKAAAAASSADEKGKARAEYTDATQTDSGNSLPVVPENSSNGITTPPATSGEKTQEAATEEKSEKLHLENKDRKKENITRALTDSGKTNKTHKDIRKKGDDKTVKERRPRKDKKSALKKAAGSTSADKQVKAKAAVKNPPDVDVKAKEETPGSSVPAATANGLNETTPPPAASENAQEIPRKEKSKKSNVKKTTDPSKANKKRKDVQNGSEGKIVRKKRKAKSVRSVPKPVTSEAGSVAPSVGAEGDASTETSASTVSHSVVNGQAEEPKSTVSKEALAEYGKRPFMRLPPTAYLDEKYITMPKRRKEASGPSSQRSFPPEHTRALSAPQRQRCANCFASFHSTEELQGHLRLQNCSNVFGFDSDDEGNS